MYFKTTLSIITLSFYFIQRLNISSVKRQRFLLPVTFSPLLIYPVLFNFLLRDSGSVRTRRKGTRREVNYNLYQGEGNQVLTVVSKNNFYYKKKVVNEEPNTNLKPKSWITQESKANCVCSSHEYLNINLLRDKII